MTRSSVFAFSLSATIVTVAVTAMPFAKWSGTPKSRSSNSAVAKIQQDLAVQLQRRFHDPNNLDFGYGRMYVPGGRLHASILQNRNAPKEILEQYDRKQEREYEQHPGQILTEDLHWVDASKERTYELLAAENPTEQSIIDNAKKQKLQIAVYTAGRLSKGQFMRVKGPAFVQSPTTNSLSDLQVAAWASKASTMDAKNFSGTAEGWHLYAERVFATESRCIGCHRDLAGQNTQSPDLIKQGDSIGLFLIAVRNR